MKYTTETFIAKITELDKRYNKNYDYSKFQYLGTFKKSIIICPIHGEFLMNPNNRLNGQDCYYCGKIKNIKPLETRFANFLTCVKEQDKKANLNYDYSKFIYKNSQDKGIIICDVHGEFEMAAKHRIQGHKCKKCALITKKSIAISTEEWIKRFQKIHKEKYIYPEIVHNGRKKISIFCKLHGIFYQCPESHAKGNGCKKCSQLLCTFRKKDWIKKANGKPGTFYILKCWNENEQFYKVGITFNSVKMRYHMKNSITYKYKVIKEETSSNLSYIWDKEKKTIKKLQKFHYTPLLPFQGSYSECFSQIEQLV